MRILVGSSASAESTDTPEKSASKFIYGTHFYRPPNPPRSERREMLQTIAERFHFNIIRVYPTWDYYNRQPNQFDFTEIEEVMTYCDEFNLLVLMGIVLETAPYWLQQAHPESRFVNAKGRPSRLEGSSAQITGGWPGLCLDWEPVREAASLFIEKLVGVVSSHRSMYAYDCWNEPHIEPAWARNIWATPQDTLFCYCKQTIAEFQRWLQNRYGTIERLNDAWVRRFPDWSAIDPPREMGTYTDWLDWRRYIIDRSTKYMHFRADNVRKHDSKHVVESHCAHHPPVDAAAVNGTNGWDLAAVVDVWGLSNFPRWRSLPVHEGAAKIEIARSNAAGKDFWMTELQGGHANQGLWRSPRMRPRDIRLWNWLAVAGGARGIVYWAYLAEATGREATGFGLVVRDGSATPRVEEAARNKQLIQQHWDLIRNYKPETEVAILFDYDNAHLAYAMSGNEEASTSSFRGYYKAVWQSDLWADFIEPESIAYGNHRLLVVPWHLMGKKETCGRIQQFAEGGGTVILETAFGLFDEHTFYNPVIPPYGLSEAFGYREQSSYFVYSGKDGQPMAAPANTPPSDQIYYGPLIEFSQPILVSVIGNTFLTPIKVTSATPIARSSGHTVAAWKKVGKGQVYYLGTNLGASITAGDEGGIRLLRSILHRISPPVVKGDKLRPRLMKGEREALLAVFNDTPEDKSESLEIPDGFHSAIDIHRNQRLEVQSNHVNVAVPYEDVKVLLLE
jgi:beta-galactosidase